MKKVPIIFLFVFLLTVLQGNNVISNNSMNVHLLENEASWSIEVSAGISASWDLTGTPIVIDNNGGTAGAISWAQATFNPWCTEDNGVYIIENVTIDGQNSAGCITIMDSTVPFILRNCHLSNAPFGGFPAEAALKMINAKNGVITNCSFLNNQEWAVYLEQSSDNEFLFNEVGFSLRGIMIFDTSDRNLFLENNFHDIGEYTIFGEDSDRINVTENNFEEGFRHIQINGDSSAFVSCFIKNNVMNQQDLGIWLEIYVENSTIVGNRINGSRSDAGIYVNGPSTNVTVYDNIVSNSDNAGLKMTECSYCNITQNYFFNQDEGIIVDGDSTNCLIIENVIRNDLKSGAGINVLGGGTHQIYRNLMENLGAGISVISADNNIISHNAFINVDDSGYDSEGTSSWSYNGIGNYHSDYAGTDSDNDGIGETDYFIHGSTYDTNPLTINPVPGHRIFIDESVVPAIGVVNWQRAATLLWYLDSAAGTKADPYKIRNITIDAQGTDECIFIRGSDKYFIIEGCTLINAGAGVYDSGIHLDTVENGIIRENNCSRSLRHGIVATQSCMYNSFVGNYISYNALYGIYVHTLSDRNNFSNNVIVKNAAIGIYFTTSDHNNVTNNYFYNNTASVNMDNSYDNRIHDNEIHYDDYAIYATDGGSHVITQNIIYENVWGIYGSNCDALRIEGNTIEDSYEDGISLEGTGENSTIIGNTIQLNQRYGLSIQTVGITNTTIVNNIFDQNSIHNAYDNGTSNNWDDGNIGNTWDDYSLLVPGAIDADDDSRGDVAYPIVGVASSQDDYPFYIDDIRFTITSPTLNIVFGTTAPNLQLSITHGVPHTIWYSLDSGTSFFTLLPNGSITKSSWLAQPDGDIYIDVYMNDTHGFSKTNQVIVIKDTVIPEIIINQPTLASEYGDTPPIFGITVTDANPDKTWYSFDGGITTASCPLTGQFDADLWSGVHNGIVTVTFYANDTVGNVGTASVIITKSGTPITTTTTEESTTTTETTISTTEPETTSEPISTPSFSFEILIIAFGLIYLKRKR